MINPLARLQQGLRKVEVGDFSTRIEVDTNDEFGQVAGGFNRMATRLQSLYGSLGEQVEVKTRHIETQRAKIESLYEVSAFLASANTIEELSKGFAKRIRTVMKADAGGSVVRRGQPALPDAGVRLLSAGHGGRGAQPAGRGPRLRGEPHRMRAPG